LLPALPEEWPDGKINEVLCRGGFEIDMAWENSKPTSVSIESLCGNNTTLVFKGSSRELNLEKGERIELNF
jgi:alpha-L-fucosidase 2